MELELHRVVIEGDSENVFKALSGECSDQSCISHIIKDCKSIRAFFKLVHSLIPGGRATLWPTP